MVSNAGSNGTRLAAYAFVREHARRNGTLQDNRRMVSKRFGINGLTRCQGMVVPHDADHPGLKHRFGRDGAVAGDQPGSTLGSPIVIGPRCPMTALDPRLRSLGLSAIPKADVPGSSPLNTDVAGLNDLRQVALAEVQICPDDGGGVDRAN